MLPDVLVLKASLLIICLLSLVSRDIYADEYESRKNTEIISEINIIREKHGLHKLKIEESAMYAASSHAQELADRQTLSHWGLNGSRVLERYRNAGGTGLKAGENLGAGDSSDSVTDAWMQSPRHRENLLHPEWFSIGVGHVRTENGRIIIVTVFTNSRWEETAFNIRDNSVILDGSFHLIRGVFPENVFIKVDNRDISPVSAAYSDKDTLALQFIFPAPPEWAGGGIAAIPLTVNEKKHLIQTDLIFLRKPNP